MSKQKAKTLLLIDDEPFWLSTMASELKSELYNVHTAESGTQALEKLNSLKPDLILSDIKMPDMNGFDLFDNIQLNPKLKSVPFVFMSALDDFDAMQVAKSLGVTDYIIKPYDVEEIKKIISKLFDKYTKI